MRKKYAIIYLMGGFGNQLFQLCFAKDLEKKNLDVYIDTSNYLPQNNRDNIVAENREITIPVKDFGFREPPIFLNLIFKINNYLRNYSFKNFKYLPIGRYNDKNFKGDLKKYNQFVGYWQDIDLIINNKDFIKTKLSQIDVFKEAIKFTPEKSSTALHIRRGDYVSMEENLNLEYYEEAIVKAKKEIENFFYDIYTDDKNWVLENEVFSTARKIYHSSSIEDTINAFSNILKYENYIISNSTFSLIPAILNENKNNKIFVPEPWFRDMEKSINYKDNWIRIKNQ